VKHTGGADEQGPSAPRDPAPEHHPNRRSSDSDGTTFSADDGATPGPGVDPGLLVGATEDEILRSYIDLVRTWRGVEARDTLRLRQADVAVLVSILGTDGAEIERRLIRATACTPKAARRGRLLLFASVGALSLQLAGGPAAGAVMPVPRAPAYATAHQVTAPATGPAAGSEPGSSATGTAMSAAIASADIGSAAIASAAAVTAAVAPDEEARPPAGEQVAPAITPAPATTTSPAPAGTGASVSIPGLGIDLPVVDGGQAVIDRGVVAHYVAEGWEPPAAAGAAGTYWLAAHHLSHGGPFANLPDIAVGAEIRVTAERRTFVYTVTSKEVVGLLPGDAAVYGTDPTAAVILLQTCVDNTRRVLVHGTLTRTE
jgi:LPXTG-site transpeptidase (sortase) family protein